MVPAVSPLAYLVKGELASLPLEQVHLDAELPYLELDAADEKNRQGSSIPLRSDLADDLCNWLDKKTDALREAARPITFLIHSNPHQAQTRLEAAEPLFNVPSGLLRILDRDLVLAGLARRVKVGENWIIDKADGAAERSTFTLCETPTARCCVRRASLRERRRPQAERNVVGVDVDKRNKPLTTSVNGLHRVERKGVEPSTSALRTQRSPN